MCLRQNLCSNIIQIDKKLYFSNQKKSKNINNFAVRLWESAVATWWGPSGLSIWFSAYLQGRTSWAIQPCLSGSYFLKELKLWRCIIAHCALRAHGDEHKESLWGKKVLNGPRIPLCGFCYPLKSQTMEQMWPKRRHVWVAQIFLLSELFFFSAVMLGEKFNPRSFSGIFEFLPEHGEDFWLEVHFEKETARGGSVILLQRMKLILTLTRGVYGGELTDAEDLTLSFIFCSGNSDGGVDNSNQHFIL